MTDKKEHIGIYEDILSNYHDKFDEECKSISSEDYDLEHYLFNLSKTLDDLAEEVAIVVIEECKPDKFIMVNKFIKLIKSLQESDKNIQLQDLINEADNIIDVITERE